MAELGTVTRALLGIARDGGDDHVRRCPAATGAAVTSTVKGLVAVAEL